MTEFKEFITSLLKRGKISKKWIGKFTDDKSMKMFRIAFTHKTFDEIDNYELYEYIGDGIVNTSVSAYLREWDPKIVSVKYLTRLKHNITSKKELALMAEGAGFLKHTRIGEELQERFDSFKDYSQDFKHKNREYLSLLEDCFEAFIGVVKLVADEKMEIEGIGFVVAYKIIKSFLQEMNISLRYEDVFDAKTRFKELCDRRGWKLEQLMKTEDVIIDEKRRFKVTVKAYPYGDMSICPANELKLSEKIYPIKADAQNLAAEESLYRLKKEFNIYDIPPNPYQRKN